MKQIIGNFDNELAKTYAGLIDECGDGKINLEEEHGGRHVVIFTGSHAIKHPYLGDFNLFSSRTKKLVHEFKVGEGLEKIGIKVPKMHGVYVNEDNGMPFLIMSRLDLTDFYELSKSEKRQATEQYAEQMTRAMNSGFAPLDVGLDTNYGFNTKEKQGYFYDFEDWGMN